jgi:hypothetical protein
MTSLTPSQRLNEIFADLVVERGASAPDETTKLVIEAVGRYLDEQENWLPTGVQFDGAKKLGPNEVVKFEDGSEADDKSAPKPR